MGFPRKEYWSGLPFPSLGDLPNPGIEPESPAFQADSLPPEPQGKPLISLVALYSFSLWDQSFWLRFGLGSCSESLPYTTGRYVLWMSSAVVNLATTLYPACAYFTKLFMPELWRATISSYPEPWDKQNKEKHLLCTLLDILFSVSFDIVVQYSLVRLIPIPKALLLVRTHAFLTITLPEI